MSHDLISGFQRGHRAIMDTVASIRAVIRSYPQAKSELEDLNDQLTAHWGREDKALFQRLLDYYASDRESIKMLEFLTHDLKDIKVQQLMFFEKYLWASGQREPKGLPVDFKAFMDNLITRIQIEEDYFFPLLEKLPVENVNESG